MAAIACTLVADFWGNPAERPAAFAADALQYLADDMTILSVAELNQEGLINENILDMAHRRLELRARALSELVRRLDRDGTLKPDPRPE